MLILTQFKETYWGIQPINTQTKFELEIISFIAVQV